MPLNPSLVGKEYPTITFPMDEDHVREFAGAVGDDVSHVPPTFVSAPEFEALSRIAGDPDLGLDFTRVVHGEQEFEWRRPLEVGEVLTVRPRIADIRAKAGHEFLVVESEMRDRQGEVVVLARLTVISRGTG